MCTCQEVDAASCGGVVQLVKVRGTCGKYASLIRQIIATVTTNFLHD